MDKVPVATTNLAAEKAAALLKLFPECAGERGEVDFEKLKQTLADHVVEGDVERYQFTWPGKRAAMAEANVPTTKTLAPCEEESVDFAKTQNLYIEGDNLEVLKILRASYLGQVKMIYIDPPYNTGHDFVYHDRFAITQEEADQRGGNVDDLGRRFTENSESNPRYHSDWCSMMYPRLKLVRDLMRDDGVIFISIDDNEVVNARKLCDAVFGEENFIADFVWQSRLTGGHDSENVNCVHEYIVVYARSIGIVFNLLASTTEYPNIDAATGRNFKWDSLWTVSHGYTENCDYPIWVDPDSMTISTEQQGNAKAIWPWMCHRDKENSKGVARWFWSRETFYQQHAELCAQRSREEIKIYKKVFGGSGIPPLSVFDKEDVGGTSTGKDELSELLGRGMFDNPKNTKLLTLLLKLGSKSDSCVLDFFSGSATTAHAVMQLNAEDGGHRKFILVQLPEVCAEGSEAAKAGYKNICEIGKERIRRAGKKIKEEVRRKNEEVEGENSKSGEDDLFAAVGGAAGVRALPDDGHAGRVTLPDVGFRVLKLVDSPMVDASKPAGETTQAELSFSSVKTGVKDDALLFHTMLRLGIAPTDTIEYKTIEGNKVACVGGVQLVAALDARTQMTNTFIEAIAKMNPGVAVFRDDTFRNNNALRISLEQTFKQLSKETKIEVI